MNLKCIAVDDEKSNLTYLSRIIAENKILNLICTTTNPLEAQSYIENNVVDLLITDINMPELSGIALNERVSHLCKTIFVTAYTDLALEAMGKNAIEILRKPFSQEAFDAAIAKAVKIIRFDKNQLANEIILRKYNLLSIAEKNILVEIGNRKTNQQISDINHISISTIESHKANIKEKLGLKTSHDLLIFAHELLKII